MKILVSDPIAESAVEELSKAGFEVDVKTGMNPEELSSVIGQYDAIIVRSATKLRKTILEKAKKMKLIVRGGVGLDNIDLEAAKGLGIAVKNTPKASAISVAELVIGMMFAMARNIARADQTMKNGLWEKKKLAGTELLGKNLGVIGLGNIGQEVCKRALALGMKVIGYDIMEDISLLEGVVRVSMDELLSRADYITLHVPFIPSIGAILGEKEFEKMKEGVRIVNCARGGVVDEHALVSALRNGKVAGAAVDVYEKEPPEYREFIEMSNVVCTPHLGASTREGQARVGEEIVKVVRDFFNV